jgi:glycerophosphoryl diester phosphodiesterase
MAGLDLAIHEKWHVDPRVKPGDDDLRGCANLLAPDIDPPAFLPQFAGPQLPPVIGHRGAAAYAPENTLAGLRRAKALRCAWVEFDVRLTRDGALVLCHDPLLDRTTNGSGSVSAASLAAIRELDAGSWFDPSFAGERMPTLEEGLSLAAQLDLGANIEIKADRGREYATAAAVAAAIQRLPGRGPALLVSSFLLSALTALREIAPEILRGVLFRLIPRNWAELALRLGCTMIGADHRRLRQRRIAAIRTAGYQVAAFTVNDPMRAQLLFDWGVSSVFSDAPDLIRSAIMPTAGAGLSPALSRQGATR